MGYKPRHQSERDQWLSLSDQQRRTALLLMRGNLTRLQMAEALGITDKTFDSHRRDLLAGLQLANVVQLTHFGIRNRLVTVSPKR